MLLSPSDDDIGQDVNPVPSVDKRAPNLPVDTALLLQNIPTAPPMGPAVAGVGFGRPPRQSTPGPMLFHYLPRRIFHALLLVPKYPQRQNGLPVVVAGGNPRAVPFLSVADALLLFSVRLVPVLAVRA